MVTREELQQELDDLKDEWIEESGNMANAIVRRNELRENLEALDNRIIEHERLLDELDTDMFNIEYELLNYMDEDEDEEE